MMKWYELDENNDPYVYVLRNLKESEKDLYWNEVYPKLLAYLKEIPFDTNHNDLLINRSVTEYEARLALSNESDRNRIYWFSRRFRGGITRSDEKYWDYNDTLESNERLHNYNNLIQYMKDTIPSDRIRTYDRCTYDSYRNRDKEWSQQLNDWCHDIRGVLSSSLNDIISMRKSWDDNGCGAGTVSSLLSLLLYQ